MMFNTAVTASWQLFVPPGSHLIICPTIPALLCSSPIRSGNCFIDFLKLVVFFVVFLNEAFPWAGETQLGVVIFLLRHTMFHLGELSSLLNESKHGQVDDHYVEAI